jgi:hypothetical protein
MLLDNCGDGNRESPATNHPTPARKESFICNFAERDLFFPAGVLVLQTAIVTSWRAFVRKMQQISGSLRFAPSTNHWSFP